MKLFLSGGGSGAQSIELDKIFLKHVDQSKPVLYIPIAINKIKHPYPDCLKWIKNNFSPLGFTNFVMWTEDDLVNKSVEDFSNFGGLYIGGGNTPKLLNDFRKFGIIKILESLVSRDFPIYGGSAGAVILTRTIIPSLFSDPNDVGLEDFLALNLIQGYDLWCHYDKTEDDTIVSFMKKFDLKKMIALPEDSGLYVDNSKIKTVGPGSVAVFTEIKETIGPDSVIRL